MEAWRGGKMRRSEFDMEQTDSKPVSEYVTAWKYQLQDAFVPRGSFQGGCVELGGSKKRDPQRGSDLKIRISDDDVCALFNALLERKSEDEQLLRGALVNIDKILNEQPDQISTDELVRSVKAEVQRALYPDEERWRERITTSGTSQWNPFKRESR